MAFYYENLSMIMAMDRKGLIGDTSSKYGLPWHYPKDLEHFWDMISDSEVIVGRKTYENIPKSKFSENNCKVTVLTNQKDAEYGDRTFNSLWNCVTQIGIYDYSKEKFVIGGKSIYESMMKFCGKAYVTLITSDEYTGDIFFDKKHELFKSWEETTGKLDEFQFFWNAHNDCDPLYFLEFERTD